MPLALSSAEKSVTVPTNKQTNKRRVNDIYPHLAYWHVRITNTTKQKCIYHTKVTQNTKTRFGRLLRPLAWKQRGPILVLVLHKFVTYLLTYLDTHLLTALGPTRGSKPRKLIH